MWEAAGGLPGAAPPTCLALPASVWMFRGREITSSEPLLFFSVSMTAV